MSFKSVLNPYPISGLCLISVLPFCAVEAAEWKSEPSFNTRVQYNDNVRLRADDNNPESSTGYTLEPRVKFAAEEFKLWDMSVDARAKITRYQDVDDSDSENLFFVFNGGRKSERTEWRLATSFERNTNFDTDYDTETGDSGLLLDDLTERETLYISPSFRWNSSENSLVNLSISSSDVSYDEVTNQGYTDYDYNSLKLEAYWLVGENHQIGFTNTYAEYDSPDADFSWDNIELNFDYKYTINKLSNIALSVGGRRLDSLRQDVLVGCEAAGVVIPIELFTNRICPPTQGIFPVTPVTQDIKEEDEGTVVKLSYSYASEVSSHTINAGRTVVPSSFGGAQEERNVAYIFDIKNTERFSTALVLDASETETLSGINSTNDRTRYRFEPSITYRLTRDWKLQFLYRYIDQNITYSNTDSASNEVYVNLYLYWPKLSTTY